MPPMASRAISARASAASITGTRLVRCWREASSGTTPPKGPCTASCDDTTEASRRPSASTAAAESSQEVSMPRTITSSVAGPDRQEDGVLAPSDEEEHALALAARPDRLLVLGDVVHRATVHLGDDVPATQPGLAGRPIRVDLGDHHSAHAALEPEVLGDLRGERLHGESQLLGAGTPGLARLALVELAHGHREGLVLVATAHLDGHFTSDSRAGHEPRQVGRV